MLAAALCVVLRPFKALSGTCGARISGVLIGRPETPLSNRNSESKSALTTPPVAADDGTLLVQLLSSRSSLATPARSKMAPGENLRCDGKAAQRARRQRQLSAPHSAALLVITCVRTRRPEPCHSRRGQPLTETSARAATRRAGWQTWTGCPCVLQSARALAMRPHRRAGSAPRAVRPPWRAAAQSAASRS
eukprot:6334534-Prymnesium_polylepis.1